MHSATHSTGKTNLPSTFQRFLPNHNPLDPVSRFESHSAIQLGKNTEKGGLAEAFRPTSSRQNLVPRFTSSGIVDYEVPKYLYIDKGTSNYIGSPPCVKRHYRSKRTTLGGTNMKL